MANVNFKKTVEEIHAGSFCGSMGGRVPKIDVVDDNGNIIKTYDWSANPAKNRIVQTGKDAFFGYRGSIPPNISTPSGGIDTLWTGSELPERMSVLQYCARGTGTAPTDVNMTALQHQIGDYTKTFVTGAPNCGSSPDAAAGTVLNKLTYLFPVGDEGIFSEVGFFGFNGTDYVMFSRVLLPEPIEITNTQSMRVSYELIFVFPYPEITRVETFDLGWGRQPVDVRIAAEFGASGTPGDKRNGLIDSILPAGTTSLPYTQWGGAPSGLFSPEILSRNQSAREYQMATAFGNGDFPGVGVPQHNAPWAIGSGQQQSSSITKLPYIVGSNKMTKKLIWKSEIPTGNINYWNLMGMGIRMVEPIRKTITQRVTMWCDISFIFN